jgi:DNA topoisomerase-1
VAAGEEDWIPLMEKFWGPFKELVDEKSESVDRTEATGARELGPTRSPASRSACASAATGRTRRSATRTTDEKLEFASLRPGQSMHTITLEDALELFKLPRKLGHGHGEEVSVGIGRFGPFAKRGSVYASLKKEDDPYTIDLARAVFLIEEKEEIARNRIIKEWAESEIQVLNGRFGPYLSDGKFNGKIPKDREPASLTLEEAQQFMAGNRQAGAQGLRREEGRGEEGRRQEGACREETRRRQEGGEESNEEDRQESDEESRRGKKAYVSPHPEPAKPLLTAGQGRAGQEAHHQEGDAGRSAVLILLPLPLAGEGRGEGGSARRQPPSSAFGTLSRLARLRSRQREKEKDNDDASACLP